MGGVNSACGCEEPAESRKRHLSREHRLLIAPATRRGYPATLSRPADDRTLIAVGYKGE